jgi:drug/metabolite transporter (DMT)-like permease
MGGQQVISWALVLSTPLLLPLVAAIAWPQAAAIAHASARAWLALAYLSAFSMFFGMLLWYRGMARAGVARVGQVQLLQPFLTLLAAALTLGEPLVLSNFLFAMAVIAVVSAGRRMQIDR